VSLGVSILDILFTMNLNVGAHLTTAELLHFITLLRSRHINLDGPSDRLSEIPWRESWFSLLTPADPDNEDSVSILSTAGG
jgi:hypothetical protein